ncbi:TetR/AcrR family transcriptional regulator, partial [Mesorhizobium sp. M00.F.Ca.ET.170.01.1.1]
MPRPANPETRSRLLEKGGDLVSTRGFNATGVQEITAAAGVPKGSFYNYFD